MSTKTFTPSDAELAASWLIDLEDVALRNTLYSGHRARRVPCMSGGYTATDHSAADAWLIEHWRQHTA